jgi:molybdenum cofactor cytidylyltransferase
MAAQEAQLAPLAARLTPDVTLAAIRAWLDQYGCVLLYSHQDTARQKIIGLSPDQIAWLMDSVNSDVLLIEADGARRLPLKAPYDHEPVIPPDTSLVVPVAGMDVLGQPLDDAHVYNAARIQDRYGFPEGGTIVPAWVAVTIRDPQLGLRGVPESARVVVLLNKVINNRYERRRARRVAQMVLRSSRIASVVLGAVQEADPVYERQQRVAAVVLAAGLSSRMRQSKALLPWDGRTVIEAIVSRLIAARIPEIVVVTGYRGEDVARVLAKSPVQIVHNPGFAQGEMLSSLKMALGALPDTISACLVVMGDQPSLDGRVMGNVLAAYAENRGEIVVPAYRGERGHPVLIGRRFWPELLALESGAPRDVIRRYPDHTAVIEVETDSILRDMDTPEQYRQERRRAGLR